jgi:hypothetical protein
VSEPCSIELVGWGQDRRVKAVAQVVLMRMWCEKAGAIPWVAMGYGRSRSGSVYVDSSRR